MNSKDNCFPTLFVALILFYSIFLLLLFTPSLPWHLFVYFLLSFFLVFVCDMLLLAFVSFLLFIFFFSFVVIALYHKFTLMETIILCVFFVCLLLLSASCYSLSFCPPFCFLIYFLTRTLKEFAYLLKNLYLDFLALFFFNWNFLNNFWKCNNFISSESALSRTNTNRLFFKWFFRYFNWIVVFSSAKECH